jgi:CO/xanthine dehydrogenase Mo-binding subunit
LQSNILHAYRIQQGDVAAAFDQADVVVEATYRTQPQEHAYLQPEAGLAQVLPDGRIEVICGGQWMHEERQQIAHALGLPEEQIIVRYPAIGGAFGGREDISIQIALALAAWKTGRPVKMIWSREESIIGHHKRHPFVIWAKWGATRDGKIVAAQVDATSDAGAYAYTSTKVLGNAILSCLGPYEIPNVLLDARTVYTNNCPSGAFRGFGGPQGHFAAEMQVNKLAAALKMDPAEFRRRNIWHEGSRLATRSVLPPGCTAPQVLEEAAKWINHESRITNYELRSLTAIASCFGWRLSVTLFSLASSPLICIWECAPTRRTWDRSPRPSGTAAGGALSNRPTPASSPAG